MCRTRLLHQLGSNVLHTRPVAVFTSGRNTRHTCAEVPYQLWLLAPLTVVCSSRVQYGCMSFYSSQTLNACVYTDTLLFYGTDLQYSTLLLLLSPCLYISPSLSPSLLPIPLLCYVYTYVTSKHMSYNEG